jgi:hypothetical protein
MTLRCTQKRGKLAERVGPDRLSLKRPGGDAQLVAFGDGHCEMV